MDILKGSKPVCVFYVFQNQQDVADFLARNTQTLVVEVRVTSVLCLVSVGLGLGSYLLYRLWTRYLKRPPPPSTPDHPSDLSMPETDKRKVRLWTAGTPDSGMGQTGPNSSRVTPDSPSASIVTSSQGEMKVRYRPGGQHTDVIFSEVENGYVNIDTVNIETVAKNSNKDSKNGSPVHNLIDFSAEEPCASGLLVPDKAPRPSQLMPGDRMCESGSSQLLPGDRMYESTSTDLGFVSEHFGEHDSSVERSLPAGNSRNLLTDSVYSIDNQRYQEDINNGNFCVDTKNEARHLSGGSGNYSNSVDTVKHSPSSPRNTRHGTLNMSDNSSFDLTNTMHSTPNSQEEDSVFANLDKGNARPKAYRSRERPPSAPLSRVRHRHEYSRCPSDVSSTSGEGSSYLYAGNSVDMGEHFSGCSTPDSEALRDDGVSSAVSHQYDHIAHEVKSLRYVMEEMTEKLSSLNTPQQNYLPPPIAVDEDIDNPQQQTPNLHKGSDKRGSSKKDITTSKGVRSGQNVSARGVAISSDESPQSAEDDYAGDQSVVSDDQASSVTGSRLAWDYVGDLVANQKCFTPERPVHGFKEKQMKKFLSDQSRSLNESSFVKQSSIIDEYIDDSPLYQKHMADSAPVLPNSRTGSNPSVEPRLCTDCMDSCNKCGKTMNRNSSNSDTEDLANHKASNKQETPRDVMTNSTQTDSEAATQTEALELNLTVDDRTPPVSSRQQAMQGADNLHLSSLSSKSTHIGVTCTEPVHSQNTSCGSCGQPQSMQPNHDYPRSRGEICYNQHNSNNYNNSTEISRNSLVFTRQASPTPAGNCPASHSCNVFQAIGPFGLDSITNRGIHHHCGNYGAQPTLSSHHVNRLSGPKPERSYSDGHTVDQNLCVGSSSQCHHKSDTTLYPGTRSNIHQITCNSCRPLVPQSGANLSTPHGTPPRSQVSSFNFSHRNSADPSLDLYGPSSEPNLIYLDTKPKQHVPIMLVEEQMGALNACRGQQDSHSSSSSHYLSSQSQPGGHNNPTYDYAYSIPRNNSYSGVSIPQAQSGSAISMTTGVAKQQWRVVNVGERKAISEYVRSEWRGTTSKAQAIREGYEAISSRLGLGHLRQIRGDNYCALRASVFQVLTSGVDIKARLGEHLPVMQRVEKAFDAHPYLLKWTFANRLEYERHTVLDTVQTCLAKLYGLLKESAARESAKERENYFVSTLNGQPHVDMQVCEAFKVLMMVNAVDYYKAYQRGDDVPTFVWLLFARDTSLTPVTLLLNHINAVGDSGGLEMVEMLLLADTLGVRVAVARPSQHGEQDFITHFPDEGAEGLPTIHLVAEDDRHYNVLLP